MCTFTCPLTYFMQGDCSYKLQDPISYNYCESSLHTILLCGVHWLWIILFTYVWGHIPNMLPHRLYTMFGVEYSAQVRLSGLSVICWHILLHHVVVHSSMTDVSTKISNIQNYVYYYYSRSYINSSHSSL